MKLSRVAWLLLSVDFVCIESAKIESVKRIFTGHTGENGRKGIAESSEFQYDENGTNEILKASSFTESPYSSPPGTPRGSLNFKLPSFTSNPSSPRHSADSASNRETSFLPFLRSSSSSPTNTPRGSFPEQQNNSLLRSTVTGDRPNYLGMFLDFASVPEIGLETLSAKAMTHEVSRMINTVSEKFNHYDGSNYMINLNRILTFVSEKYVLTPFIIHLAGLMLYNLGPKAPNALELFIEQKMPFLAKSSRERVPELTITNLFESRELRAASRDNQATKGYIALQKTLQDQISAGFLNYVPGLNFDELMMFYMTAFNNCKSSAEYAKRIAAIAKVLIDFTASSVEKNSDVTFLEIENTLRFDFEKFSSKFDQHYGVDS